MCGGNNADGPPDLTEDGVVVVVDQATNSYLGTPTSSSKRKSTNDITLKVGVAPAPKRVPTKKYLETILQNDALTNALQSFLENEFCVENLLYIKRTMEYQDKYNSMDIENEEERIELGKIRDDIQREFMLPTSNNEVNIPAKVKRECLLNIEKLKMSEMKMDAFDYKALAAKLFDQCEDHVKMVLVHERVGRFQTTETFARLAQQVPGL